MVFIPQAQPHAQSLFLFPIVFGINFIKGASLEPRPSSAPDLRPLRRGEGRADRSDKGLGSRLQRGRPQGFGSYGCEGSCLSGDGLPFAMTTSADHLRRHVFPANSLPFQSI